MTPAVAFRLGRVSNLPTVWTNVLAALALAGAPLFAPPTLVLVIGLSLFYVAGMYLNDAFDSPLDAFERPERPIPAGQVSRTTVFVLGFAGLAAGIAIVAASAVLLGPGGDAARGVYAALAAAALAGAIVLYDAWHKANPVSPVLMGLNRMLVYAAVAVAATGELAAPVLGVGALLLCYVIGLTYAAKQEHLGRVASLWPLVFLAAPFVAALALLPEAGTAAYLMFAILLAWVVYAVSLLLRKPPPVGRAVVSLIAGICLFDGLWLALTDAQWGAGMAVAGFVVTLGLQRWVSGT